MKNRYEMRSTKDGSFDLMIYGDIGKDFFAEESNDAITIAKKIQNAGAADLNVYISSYGGSLADGLVIFNALQRYTGKTVANIDGMAYSVASLIPLGCDIVRIASNATMMIHAPHTPHGGNATELRKTADTLEKIASSLVDAYTRNGIVDAKTIAEWLNDGEDHYLTADEALKMGLVDEITGPIEIAASFETDITNRFKSPFFGKTTGNETGDEEMTENSQTVNDEHENKITDSASVFVAGHKKAVAAGVSKGALAENKRIHGIEMAFDGLADPDDDTNAFNALMSQCKEDINCSVESANIKIVQLMKEFSGDPLIKPLHAAQAHNGGSYQNSRISRNMSPAVSGMDSADKFIMGASRALEIRAGLESDPEKIREERKGEFLSMSLLEMGKHSLQMAGVPITGSAEQIARKIIYAAGPGQGTDHFPAILENIVNKSMMDGYSQAEEVWNVWTKRGTLQDYRQASRVNKSLFTALDKMEEFESFKHGKYADVKQNITGFLHGKSFSLSLQAIVNDDMSVLADDSRSFGEAANRTIGDAVYLLISAAGTGGYGQVMTEDSKVLFHADHSNYIASGSGAAPSKATIGAGRTAMMSQTDPNGVKVASMPRYLLHGTTLTMDVIQLLNSQNYITGADATMGERNPVASVGLQSVEEHRLDGLATTAWMLASRSNTVEVAFVGGQSTPTVDRMPAGEIPGITWQISIPFGVAALDFRTMYLNWGA